jgi:hypothetical protein
MSSEKKFSPFRQAIMCLLLGIASVSFTLPCFFIPDESVVAFGVAHGWLLSSLVYLSFELPAIAIAVGTIRVSYAARKHSLFLRDERLLVASLCLSYFALLFAGIIIVFLPVVVGFGYGMRRGHF